MASAVARLFPMLSQLLRDRGSEAGPIVLNRRRIYILPTRHGVLFGALLLTMLVGSINYSLSLGYVLTFLLGGIAMAGILQTYKNLQGISIDDGGALPAFSGENASFTLLISAPGPRFSIKLRVQEVEPVLFDLNDANSQRITISVPAVRRGRLRPGRFTLFTSYPLGLFRAWSYVQFDHAATIYPIPATTSLEFKGSGENGSALRVSTQEGSEDFAGLRAWQPGDSPRQVAWKVAARNDELATKRFSDTEGRTVIFDWGQLANMDNETRLSQLTRWVLDAEQKNLNYGLRIPGMLIDPGNGGPHRHRCLEALALFGLDEHG